MARLLAFVEYDGTDFEGFQLQKRGRTVQGELEKALYRITGERLRVVGSGRTDSGVHAQGQAVHFDSAWSRSTETLLRALNALLPKDIAVHSIRKVPDDFSARYSAKSRWYRYTILNQPVRSPLEERYSLYISDQLDVGAMDIAARLLLGVHDFGAFGTPPHGENSVREMLRTAVVQNGTHICVDLEANAFLYRMVRRIVGTLLQVGRGQLTKVEEFGDVMAKRRRAGQSVPAHGLCLVAVKYDLPQMSGVKDENI